MAQVNIRIEDDLKASADILFNDLGLNMSTAINLFVRQAVRQAVRQGGIPFQITTKVDPFYSEANQAYLKKVIQEAESGKAKMIVKTMGRIRGHYGDN